MVRFFSKELFPHSVIILFNSYFFLLLLIVYTYIMTRYAANHIEITN